MSYVMCHVLQVTYNMSLMQTAIATDPANSPSIHISLALKNPQTPKQILKPKNHQIV